MVTPRLRLVQISIGYAHFINIDLGLGLGISVNEPQVTRKENKVSKDVSIQGVNSGTMEFIQLLLLIQTSVKHKMANIGGAANLCAACHFTAIYENRSSYIIA